MRALHILGLPSVAVGCALAVAACGSSSKPVSSASNNEPAALEFSECMRANGVSNFPDSSGTAMRIGEHGQTVSVNGVSVNASAFTGALEKCDRYRPHTNASPAQTAPQMRRGLEFARCMRSHGVPNFPDPQVRAGSGGNQEVYLPGVNIESPAVKSAAKACGGGPKGA